MSAYVNYLGEMCVAEEKREEFSARVLEILRQGGMMRLGEREFAGKRLSVLCLPEPDDEGIVTVNYAYFGDSEREPAEYRVCDARFHTREVGDYEFRWVVTAVYILYECYSDHFGMTVVDGKPFDATPYLSWLNGLFGETYTNERAGKPWRMYELLHRCGYADGSDAVREIANLYEPGDGGIYEFAEYLYVSGGPEAFQDFIFDDGAAPDPAGEGRVSLVWTILQAEPTVRQLRSCGEKTDGEMLSELRRILLSNPAEEEPAYDPMYDGFVILLRLLSGRIMAKAVAAVFGLDFWEFWDSLGGCSWDGALWQEKRVSEPEAAEPMSTARFVEVSDEEICFCRVERETGERNFHTSDDDRAFCWRHDGGDVCFSDAMRQWLADLQSEYAGIGAAAWKTMPAGKCLTLLADLLSDANSFYQRIYAFDGMLCDFEAHAGERAFQGAVLLLERLIERNRVKGGVIGDTVYNWEMADRNLTFNEGRLAVRRYLAVLANRRLRGELFGF